MRHLRHLRRMLVSAVVAVVVLLTTTAGPAAAAAFYAEGTQYYSLFAPYYCATNFGAAGQYENASSPFEPVNWFDMVTVTQSRTSQGDPQGDCIYQSARPAGYLAAMPRLQVWYGAWVVCVPGVHATNGSVSYEVGSALSYFEGCGADSSYRLWSGSRITRAGGNDYSDLYLY